MAEVQTDANMRLFRLHSAVPDTSSAGNDFDIVEEDGTEYLVQDVVAQREGVYFYPDPDGGIRKEFVSADELKSAIEGAPDEVLVVLEHPTLDDGSGALTTHPRANYTEVGKWVDLRMTRDEKGIAGRVMIRRNEVGNNDGMLKRYVRKVRQHGIGEVSTGYDLDRALRDTGRYNGIEYDYQQEGVDLDHLALLVDEQGDCSEEDGCGLGRANAANDTLARVNNHVPRADDPEGEDLGEIDDEKRLNVLQRVAEALGLGNFVRLNISVHEPSYSGKTESSWSKPSLEDFTDKTWDDLSSDEKSDIAGHFLVSKSGFPPDSYGDLSLPVVEPDGELNLNGVESALKLASQVEGLSGDNLSKVESILEGLLPDDRQNMEDEEKIDELVQEHGLTRENLTPLVGSECLDRIHKVFDEQEGDGESETMGDNPDDDPEDGVTEEQIEEMVREQVDEAVEEAVGDIEIEVDAEDLIDPEELLDADTVVEQVEEARANQQKIEKIVQSDEFDLEREKLERMNDDALDALAEQIEEEEDDRVNYAGRPSGTSIDLSEFRENDDGPDIPAPGEKWSETDDGGE